MPRDTEKKLKERFVNWASQLTKEQMVQVIYELGSFCCMAEEVSFHSEALAPYWSNTGDSLVEGQKTYNEE